LDCISIIYSIEEFRLNIQYLKDKVDSLSCEIKAITEEEINHSIVEESKLEDITIENVMQNQSKIRSMQRHEVYMKESFIEKQVSDIPMKELK